MKKKRLCIDNADFQRAIVFKRSVEVWIAGELDSIGKIESYNDESVKIDGGYFLRMNCRFLMI